MVHADIEFIAAQVLGEVNEAGVAMFKDVINEFLDYAKDDEFLFGVHAFAVIVEAAAGVHAAGAADFLEEVVYGAFQAEIFERRRHQAVRDIADKLDGIVDNLFGVVDALQLAGFVEVHQVFVQVEAGGSQEGAGVVVQVGCDAGAFFFLEADGCVQEHLLLVLFHSLELELVAYDFPLVKHDKNDESDREHEHAYCAEEEDRCCRVSNIGLEKVHFSGVGLVGLWVVKY